MDFDAPMRRRSFLRLSAGLLAVSQLRVAGIAAAKEPAGTLYVLSDDDVDIFAAIADRITDTGDPSMPRFSDTAGVRTVDTALRQLPGDAAQQFRGGLTLFQYAPLFSGFGFAKFTSLAAEQQDAYLRAWEGSRFQTPRLAFQAFKNLAMLGYYADDRTWKGISYGGPWAPRPRRVIGNET